MKKTFFANHWFALFGLVTFLLI